MIDVSAPQFTASDAARIAEMDPGLLKLWIGRGLLKPARIERLPVRRRPHFSVLTIFKAKLMVLIGKSLSIGPSNAKEVADLAELEAVKNQIWLLGSAEGWMLAFARIREKEEAPDIIGAATLSNDYWDVQLYRAGQNFVPAFGTGDPYGVLPFGAIFDSVKQKCRDLLLHDTQRARS